MLDFLNIRKWTGAQPPVPPPAVEDSLEDFGSEDNPASLPPASVRFADALKPARAGRRDWRLAVAVAAVIVLATTAYTRRSWRPFDVEAASASLTIESIPAGAEVFAAGVSQGRTPLTMSVTPGEHNFELVREGRRKPLNALARAGAAVVHHVEFEPEPVEAPKKGSIQVTTEPARLKVVVDGVPRGSSPIVIDDLEPGTHRVQVIGATKTVDRDVDVAAGESASVVVTATTTTAPPAGPAAGWLTVSSPVTLQVVEGKDIIGTSASPKIMLPTGRHELSLTNESIGFSERRVVQLRAGSTATIRVDLPNAPLSINALPWADVWLDGTRIGETPIGNRPVRLGTHEIVFRHPQLGERRQTVTVTLTAPARVSVDMRKSGS